jgi:predicted nucleic acid-binding protein
VSVRGRFSGISSFGGSAIERVAADANVLLSAIIGKAALKVFTRFPVEVVTVVSVLEEVREYLPVMAESYGLAPEVLDSQFRLLAIQPVQPAAYRGRLVEARKKMHDRDPDDAELLALALALKIPIWSNDNDFGTTGIEWYTTAQLLKKLQGDT